MISRERQGRQGGWERMATLLLLVLRVKILFAVAWEIDYSW